MRRTPRTAMLAVAALVVIPTAVGSLTTAAASATTTTTCNSSNSGWAGGGSTYWGWCKTGGGYVHYEFILNCPAGGGGSGWGSGTGGEVYTPSQTCWFGARPNSWEIYNANGSYFGGHF
jgi:hypothetical protein